ncbi:hypothetical protein [Actinomadura oligospora]|uniref:hypothetical protein n=1 Tax=Actinomadura oligospora TaxID=111804 RepID=UPI00047A2ED2|nr:hypothetical protein [Actinomadura oligospora]
MSVYTIRSPWGGEVEVSHGDWLRLMQVLRAGVYKTQEYRETFEVADDAALLPQIQRELTTVNEYLPQLTAL